MLVAWVVGALVLVLVVVLWSAVLLVSRTSVVLVVWCSRCRVLWTAGMGARVVSWLERWWWWSRRRGFGWVSGWRGRRSVRLEWLECSGFW